VRWPLRRIKLNRARLLGIVSQHLTADARAESTEKWPYVARVREIGLEWKHPKMVSKTLAS